MPGPSKVIVLDPDVRAGRQIQLGFQREGVSAQIASIPVDLRRFELPTEETGLVVVGGADTRGVDLVRRTREVLEANHADVPIVFAGRAASRKDLEAAGADEVLVQPAYLRDVVTVGRLLVGQPAHQRTHLVGNLADLTGVLTLIRALSALGRSAVLTLIRGLRRGEIRFYRGEVTSAQVGLIHGQAALHQLLLWTDARFDFHHEDIVRRQQIPLDHDELFADAERFLEGIRDSSGSLSPSMVLEQDRARVQAHGKQIPAEVQDVLRMFDGHRVLADVLEDSPYRVFETLRVAQRALDVGLLRKAQAPRPKATWRAVLAIEEWLVGTETKDEVVARTTADATVPVPKATETTGKTSKSKKHGGSRRQRKKRRANTPLPVAPATPASTTPSADIDWGALVPRTLGAEVGPLAGVVPAAQRSGEIVLPSTPTRDQQREKLEALMDTGKRERIFPTDVGLEPSIVLSDAATSAEVPDDTRARAEADRARADAERAAAALALAQAAKAAAEEKAKADARAKAEAEARAKQEAEARAKADADRAKAEAEARAKSEAEARAKADADRAKAEAEARAKADAEARATADAETRAKADAETRAKQEAEARAKGEAETRAMAEAEARAKHDGQAPTRQDAEARANSENAAARADEAEARDAKIVVDVPLPGDARTAASTHDPAGEPVRLREDAQQRVRELVARHRKENTELDAVARAGEQRSNEPAEATRDEAAARAQAQARALAEAAQVAVDAEARARADSETRARDAGPTTRVEADAIVAGEIRAKRPTSSSDLVKALLEDERGDGRREIQTEATIVTETATATVSVFDRVSVTTTERTARLVATPETTVAEVPFLAKPVAAATAVTGMDDAETRPFIKPGAEPEDIEDEPSDGVIRAQHTTVESELEAAVMRRPPPGEIPVDDRPPQTTGEIRSREASPPPPIPSAAEPSILVADLQAAHVAASAVATGGMGSTAAAAPAANAAVAAATPGTAAAAASEEVAQVRRDATAAFTQVEEEFFRAGVHQEERAPRLASASDSFDDLDEGYEPVGFWDRLLGRKKKR